MTTPQISQLRTVAFLDILGFRHAILTTPLSELANQYERRMTEADWMMNHSIVSPDTPSLFPDHPPNTPLCQRFFFSDSIILVSIDDQAISALKLLIHAWRLSQAFMAFNMPLRGGIAFGELYSNPQRNICLGRALTDAYEFEKTQAWIGVAIHDSVAAAFPMIIKNTDHHSLLNVIFFDYPVPLKNGSVQNTNTLNWRFNLIVEKGTRSLFVSDGPPDVMQKVANTLKYAESVVRSGHIYVADQSNLPRELRSMWVGDKEPPFPHGDEL